MRRCVRQLVIAMVVAVTPAWASAGEQEDKQFAQGIAGELRSSGLMKDYSVGVKAKDGTVWLNGRVANSEQLNTCLQLVSDIDGVDQIVNNLQVGGAAAAPASATPHMLAPGQPAPPRPMNAARPALQAAAPVAYNKAQVAPGAMPGRPMPMYSQAAGGVAPASYDQPNMPGYSWPSYAAYPNYAAVTYPKQYSASAWPYIGPFYPYPQVPMGWRKVSLEWDDGWWFLDFDDRGTH